jgi:hypothetical protein
MIRARKKRKIVSEKLMRPSYCRSRKSGNRCPDKVLTKAPGSAAIKINGPCRAVWKRR